MKAYWKVVKNISKYLIKIGFKWLWAYVDKNKDGKISKEELRDFLEYINIETEFLYDELEDEQEL